MTTEPIGLCGLDSLHFYVRDFERTRRLLCDTLDFQLLGESSVEMTERGKQKSYVFQASHIRLVVSTPIGEGGRASRFLNKHPEGVGTIAFLVEDIDKAFKLLGERDATFISGVHRFEDEGGSLSTFSITTPFGDTTFRFFQRDGYAGLYPEIQAYEAPTGGQNAFGFGFIDHITSNFQTMKPALLWMEHVMGFEQYWDVEFHTHDVAPGADVGSGLKSVVMWDPYSRLKFANNEPWAPHFKASQINVFGEDHRGDGIQHAALITPDILTTVKGLRARGAKFMPTPGAYYDMLPERLERLGVNTIDEDVDVLRGLGVLVDGAKDHAYMLQIFMHEAATQHDDPAAGPFFFEVIQRKGDRGFGAGNFRALFESIERQQVADGRI